MDRPMVWSIGSADPNRGDDPGLGRRTAEALGVELHAVSGGVGGDATDLAAAMDARLSELSRTAIPDAIHVGHLASAEAVAVVASWVDRLRACNCVALVVDLSDVSAPGAVLATLVPRATVVVGSQEQVARLLNAQPDADFTILPEFAEALMAAGAQAVCIAVAEDSADGPLYPDLLLDWLASAQAHGWLGAPWRVGDPLPDEVVGAGLVKAVGVAAALARGFVCADAIVLGRMVALQATRSAVANAVASTLPEAGFALDASLMPMLSPGRLPRFARRNSMQRETSFMRSSGAADTNHFDLYAVVDSVERLMQVLEAGVRTVQLRLKAPVTAGLQARASWQAYLYRSVQRSVEACRNFGAELFINDYWMVAQSLGAAGVHLGQEDLLALDDVQHAQLMMSGLAIGISTHSLWELCRARSMAPQYVACGPVWPTTTKTMPWRPQGLDHLAWWCVMAQTRVVAIGGILEPAQVTASVQSGADGVCVIRALGEDPCSTVPALQQALRTGRVSSPPIAASAFPPTSLPSVFGKAHQESGEWHAACA